MTRFILKDLIKWKTDKNRKPLIMEGARQVGKTWILNEFGKTQYENYAYINCDRDANSKKIFYDFDTDRILKAISAMTSIKIKPHSTLIIIDEIQEIPSAITSLKYFCEEKRDYDIVAAGSLLGLNIHQGTGFPVGKVDMLKMYPMSFMEFLLATGKKELFELIASHKWEYTNALDTMCREVLKDYYFTGGMPEVVSRFIEEKDIFGARKIQNRIINDYSLDFSKHISSTALAKVEAIWNSIPIQLAKENKKFAYSLIKSNSRGRDYQEAVQWLIDAGLIHKVCRIKSIEKPLKFFEDAGAFKLYANDLGLLGAMNETEPKDYIVFEKAFEMFKGAFTEQFIAQQYFAAENSSDSKSLFYYTNEKSTSEIDFVFQKGDIYPVEVKGGRNLYSKSLSSFLKSAPQFRGIRFSMAPYKKQDNIVNVPLYLAEEYMRSILAAGS